MVYPVIQILAVIGLNLFIGATITHLLRLENWLDECPDTSGVLVFVVVVCWPLLFLAKWFQVRHG